jgi:hypothetical protein
MPGNIQLCPITDVSEKSPSGEADGGEMVVVWATVPFMVVGLIMAYIVGVYSVHEHHRMTARGYITGELPVPDDGALRIAVVPTPVLAGAYLQTLGDEVARMAGSPSATVWRSEDDQAVLITVPPGNAKGAEQGSRIVAEMKRNPFVEDVFVVESRNQGGGANVAPSRAA